MEIKDKSNQDHTPDTREQKNSTICTNSTNSLFYSSIVQSEVCNDINYQEILLAIQNSDLAQQVKGILTSFCVKELKTCTSSANIVDSVLNIHPSILILESPWNNNIDTLNAALEIRQMDRRFPIILVTTKGSEALAISALRAGVKDYFSSSFLPHEFNATVNRCISNYHAPRSCIKKQLLSTNDQQFIGESLLMTSVKTYLRKLALVDSHVLITGETGTGKELTAQYIHQHSARHDKPFIAINCAAIPDGLLESELFGYEKGAFTGAHCAYAGKLKLADGGSVFFDEIGDMSPYTQAKILRVIESKEVYPLGAKRSVPINIRVIAATNCDLENMVLKKDFRQDLYFRLNVARIQLPPLRDRKEDIECLINHYLNVFSQQFGYRISGFTTEAWELMLHYGWPGNIRELKNVLETIFIDPPANRISIQDLPNFIRSLREREEDIPLAERDLLLSTLRSVHWNKSKAAEQLQWSRMTLYRKMEKYQIIDIK